MVVASRAFCFTPQAFRASQARKGAKGGKVSTGGKISKGGGRPTGTIKADSIAQVKPWENLGISRATYFRKKKAGLLE